MCSQNSVVSIVNRLWAGCSGFHIPARAKDLSLIQNVQTGSGTHPASCSIGTGHPSPGGIADLSLPSTVSNYRYTSTPPACLNGVYRDFTFAWDRSVGRVTHTYKTAMLNSFFSKIRILVQSMQTSRFLINVKLAYLLYIKCEIKELRDVLQGNIPVFNDMVINSYYLSKVCQF